MQASCSLERSYVYYPEKFKKNFLSIREAFNNRFPEFRLSYSVKTNNCPAVLETLYELNGTAEVVSPEEYSLAKKIGFNDSSIIYNGICKDNESFLFCAEHGGIVNIDNQQDLDFAIEYFERTACPLTLGVRINFDIGNHIKSHFGVRVDSPLYQLIIQKAVEGCIKINVLHCHFTQARELEFWNRRVQGMCKAYRDFKNCGIDIQWLDFGGNMNAPATGNISMEQYADCIAQEMKMQDVHCGVILECGTPLVSNAFTIQGNVIAVKENCIVTDLSIFNMGLNALDDTCRIKIFPNSAENNDSSAVTVCKGLPVVGYTCMENDIIKKSWCGKVCPGYRIVIYDCGAYSYSWRSDFIKNKLPVTVKLK